MEQKKKSSSKSTSWQNVHKWYDEAVGSTGHYYHKAIILPKTLQLLELKEDSSLLDLACGQGILAKSIPRHVRYTGVDASKSLIKSAEKGRLPNQQFFVGDITKTLPLAKNQMFSHAAIILALQNIENPKEVFNKLAPHLMPGARFIIVMNHPCFRIPRQTQWAIDEDSKLQYRRTNLYMSPQKIPIHTHPSDTDKDNMTWSFHHPLSAFAGWLKEASFAIETIGEWCSDKVSTGATAKMENRARKEFPLFLTIVAKYIK